MTELPSICKEPITRSQLVKYAGASGDFNPIHTVVPVAKQAGFDDVIAHGMLVMGFAGQALAEWFPRKDLRSFTVRFTRKTVPGERLTVFGTLNEENGHGEITVCNEAGEQKLKGNFEIVK